MNPKQSFLCSENRNYLHAIAAKGAQKKTLEELIEEKSRVIEVNESNLTKLTLEKESMENTLNISQSEIVQLWASVEAPKCQLEAVSAEKNRSIEHLDEELQAKEEMERELIALKQSSKQTLAVLERENHGLQQSLRVIEQQMTLDIQELTSERDILLAKMTELDEELRRSQVREKCQSEENVRIAFQFAQLNTEKENIQKERDEDKQKMQTLGGELSKNEENYRKTRRTRQSQVQCLTASQRAQRSNENFYVFHALWSRLREDGWTCRMAKGVKGLKNLVDWYYIPPVQGGNNNGKNAVKEVVKNGTMGVDFFTSTDQVIEWAKRMDYRRLVGDMSSDDDEEEETLHTNTTEEDDSKSEKR
jgi:hypothetical protein